MRTRTRKTNSSEAVTKISNAEEKAAKLSTLPPSVIPAPNVFIIPKNISNSARILSVKTAIHDQKTESRRFLICPKRGFFEFTRIMTPKNACRSWLLSPGVVDLERPPLNDGIPRSMDVQETANDEAYVLQSPDLMVATRLDPLFFMLSIKGVLWPNSMSGKPVYLTIDSRLGLFKSQNEEIELVLGEGQQGQLERLCADRIKTVCDLVEIPGDEDEPMYCLSLKKLYIELVRIAKQVVVAGLPKSMDERFVRQQLIVPELGIRKEVSSASLADKASISAKERSQSFSGETNTSLGVAPAEETSDTGSAIIGQVETEAREASVEIHNLLRVRTVIKYMMVSYLPSDLRKALQEAADKMGQEESCVDFKPLDDFLVHTAKLRTEANVLRSLSENIIRKRSALDDEENFEKVEAKKRKMEQEEFRKKNTTRGVQQLAKADTSGMKKLSAFFTKSATKKA